jgi:hypothetical protein
MAAQFRAAIVLLLREISEFPHIVLAKSHLVFVKSQHNAHSEGPPGDLTSCLYCEKPFWKL